ncbi:ComEC/Rec2 family competence protein [Fibrobacter sp. UWCM]|uniref:ComEC/Rec2 family competence protein n=1 Tax=Fibrobacter sp. UWCM TaxID=1896208 RepID=UPI0020C8BAF0|nr:MBL fold metallo-hydrolase [Fibrobacter sp. UWCM]
MRYFFLQAKMLAFVAIFALVASCGFVIEEGAPEPSPLRVTFLDVGQGLAVLLDCGGRYAMYDMGPDSVGVIDSLVARGVDTLEWVVVSHNHRDHAGGFMELAGRGGGSGSARVGGGLSRAGNGLFLGGTAPRVGDSLSRVDSLSLVEERLSRVESLSLVGGGLSRAGDAPRVYVRRLYVGPDTSGGFIRDSVLRVARGFGIPVDTLVRGMSLGLAACGAVAGIGDAGGLPSGDGGSLGQPSGDADAIGQFSGDGDGSRGLSSNIGDAPRFDVLWPPDYVREGGNPASVVVRVEFGAASLLLTGDLDSAGERRLLELSPTLSAGLLQVPHHGSAGSSSLRFISRVAPDYAVVSVGAGNAYGHPREEVVRKYAYVLGDTARFFRTDLQGSVGFEMWPDGVVVDE